MNEVLEYATGYWMAVASHLWQTTMLILFLSGLALILKRAPARVLNALWWVALAKLVVPVSIVAPAVSRALGPVLDRLEQGSAPMEAVTVWLHRAGPVLDPIASVARPTPGLPGALGLALLVAWAVGASWFAVVWLRSRDWRVVGESRPIDGLSTAAARGALDALQGTRIPAGAVLVTREPLTPSVVGIFRRRIILSVDVIERLEPHELRAILLHEDAHRRRFEPLQVLVQRVAVAAFYFFPPLWPVLRRLRETSEMACDEAAVRQGVRPERYATALARTLNIGLEPLGLAVGLARGTPTLTRSRFERLRNEGRFTPMRWHWACLVVAVLAAVATAVLSAIPTIAGEPEGGATSVKTEVTTDENGDRVMEVTIEGEEEEEATYTVTLLHSEPPEYPEDAKTDGVGGRVVLELMINSDGTVGEVTAVQEVEDYPSLTEAATEAASQWTFEIQGEVDGEQTLEVIVPIEFKMDGEKTKTIKITVPDATEAPEAPGEPEEPDEADAPE